MGKAFSLLLLSLVILTGRVTAQKQKTAGNANGVSGCATLKPGQAWSANATFTPCNVPQQPQPAPQQQPVQSQPVDNGAAQRELAKEKAITEQNRIKAEQQERELKRQQQLMQNAYSNMTLADGAPDGITKAMYLSNAKADAIASGNIELANQIQEMLNQANKDGWKTVNDQLKDLIKVPPPTANINNGGNYAPTNTATTNDNVQDIYGNSNYTLSKSEGTDASSLKNLVIKGSSDDLSFDNIKVDNDKALTNDKEIIKNANQAIKNADELLERSGYAATPEQKKEIEQINIIVNDPPTAVKVEEFISNPDPAPPAENPVELKNNLNNYRTVQPDNNTPNNLVVNIPVGPEVSSLIKNTAADPNYKGPVLSDEELKTLENKAPASVSETAIYEPSPSDNSKNNRAENYLKVAYDEHSMPISDKDDKYILSKPAADAFVDLTVKDSRIADLIKSNRDTIERFNKKFFHPLDEWNNNGGANGDQ